MGSLVSKDHQPTTGFDPIPEGQYSMEVNLADYIPTRDGSRNTLKCEFRVIKGDFKGRRIWHYFNFESDNETARKISIDHADALLKGIYGEAVEASDVKHFIKLIKGRTFKANVGIQEAEAGSGYSDQNRVNKFLHTVDDPAATDGGKKKKKKKKKKEKPPWED